MPEQISRAQLDALKKYTSPEISDTIRMMGVRPATEGYLGYDVRCLFPDLGPMVGFAVTAILDNLTPDRPARPDVQRRYLESIEASPKPAVIVIKAGGHNRVRSLVFGGIMANTARSLGAIGLVTDGGVRDPDDVYDIGFHMFAPGTVSAHGTGAFVNMVDTGNPVTISDQLIRPGDLVFADKIGVITIPHEVVEDLPSKVEELHQREAGQISFLQSEEFSLPELLKRSGLD